MAKPTFGELLKRAQARKGRVTFSSVYDESGTSELPTPRPTGSSDPSTTTYDVITIPTGRRGMIRKDSSQDSSADPQQEEQE